MLYYTVYDQSNNFSLSIFAKENLNFLRVLLYYGLKKENQTYKKNLEMIQNNKSFIKTS